MCFTGRSLGVAVQFFALALTLCVCVRACVRACLRALAVTCGQSVVAAVGGTAGQADNRV